MEANRNKITAFISRWTGRGYEKGESQVFWIELLQDLFGIETPSGVISFEDQVKLDHTSFIDGYIKSTHVMIEQKSRDKDLRAPIRQSDGSLLNPFQQAKRYASELPYSDRPRWIVTCNFKSFLVYDMEQPNGEPVEVLLENLEKDAHMLRFLVLQRDERIVREEQLSQEAGRLVGEIYDAFLQEFPGEVTAEDFHSLNVLCVRLVFCLYAEDAGLFGKSQFYDYMKSFRPQQMRMALKDLFQVLDTEPAKRDRFLEPSLAAFPYVNGTLFCQQPHEVIPPFSENMAHVLLEKASCGFDWSGISPTIFGAVFESTLNPETRRSGGMHYTSIENIHKVIDPLFLDKLREELAKIELEPVQKKRAEMAAAFQDKIARLKFLDPACGSGNFLTETYLSLRRLENRAIEMMRKEQTGLLGFDNYNPIKVSIHQFYGIEINDFAVSVATTALWIAEAQMMEETRRIFSFSEDFFPLKSYTNIREGNALRIDWNDVVPASELNYIMGNPPFVGFTFESEEQKADMGCLFPGIKNLDYVCGWYKMASNYIVGTNIRCAFVSTNSITQGETVPRFWPQLAVQIDFAYKSFVWNSEASAKAHVHCVILGFSSNVAEMVLPKKLYSSSGQETDVSHINSYLLDMPDVYIESRNKPLCNVPQMIYGNKPVDGGALIIEENDYNDFLKQEPNSRRWIYSLTGAEEYLKNKKRYCLWLVGITPSELKSMPLVYQRVLKCKKAREDSPAAAIRKFAETPHLFAQRTQPENVPYIIVPLTTGETRKYIPLGFMPANVKCTNACSIIPNAGLYHFGIIEANVHMAWMRAFCGRLEMRYRYSKEIVYNNFPWPTPTEQQKEKIEQTAQAILDARKIYPDCSLADLYDEATMPIELRKAHQANDRAVMEAYGFPVKDFTESDCVAELLKLYQNLVGVD